jgi:hypothetical protein
LARRRLIFGSPTWQASGARDLSQLPIISRTKAQQGPSDLLKILGQELRENYELPHDLRHGMFTLLMELNDRGGSPALRTRADKYRAIAEGARNKKKRPPKRRHAGDMSLRQGMSRWNRAEPF